MKDSILIACPTLKGDTPHVAKADDLNLRKPIRTAENVPLNVGWEDWARGGF